MPIPSNERLQLARLYQEFGHQPVLEKSQCPLQAVEFAIFPVRYALDESPAKGSGQGPNPLPRQWTDTATPALRTRSLTLRQLRDGWLYVWDEHAAELHEYQVRGLDFIPHPDTADPASGSNSGEARPYLLYRRDRRLRLAFSPVRWSWRLRQRLRSHVALAPRWMREVDLPRYATSMQIPHGAPLHELGSTVADVLTDADTQAPTFHTCQVTAVAQGERPLKEAVHEAMVRGVVPDQNNALFIALDDPVGVLEDLHMNLNGRRLEFESYLQTHERRLHIALLVQALCGADLQAVIPAHIAQVSEAREQFTREAHALLEHEARLREMIDTEGDKMFALRNIDHMRRKFRDKWRTRHLGENWQAVVDQWCATHLWRNDVRFDDAREYTATHGIALERLERHVEASEQDLRAWLEHIGPHPEDLGYDICQAEHSIDLLDEMAGLCLNLGASESGKAWLYQQFHAPTTLTGLALFNFTPELAEMALRLSTNFIDHGTLDELGKHDDGSGHAYNGASDATNVASRVNEMASVLDLPSVKASRLYQSLSETARAALDALRQATTQGARTSWELIGKILLPALRYGTGHPKQGMAYNVILLLVSPDMPEGIGLRYAPNFEMSLNNWQYRVRAVQTRIDETRQALTRESTVAQRNADRLRLARLEMELHECFLSRPLRIVGFADTLPERDPRRGWLENLGRAQLLDALRNQASGALDRLGEAHQRLQAQTGGLLPLLVAGLNLWNLSDSLDKARRDGVFNDAELRTVGANMAYTGNALMALWTMPAWGRWAGMEAALKKGKVRKLTQVGVTAWLKVGNNEFASLSRKLIARTVGMAAFGAIAAGVEAWQVGEDIDNATSLAEINALSIKQLMLWAMTGVAGTQVVASALGHWFSYGWIMSSPVTITIVLIGVIYLLASLAANYLKREGLRLWLYRCCWGREPAWADSEDHYARQLHLLWDICRRPGVVAKSLVYPLDKRRVRHNGFWLQVLLPADLPCPAVRLRPAMRDSGWQRDHALQARVEQFRGQFLEGHWAPLECFEKLPDASLREGRLPPDTLYTADDRHRLWQVWVNYPHKPILELEIHYPRAVHEPVPLHRYLYRLQIRHTSEQAERQDNPFDDLPLHESYSARIDASVLLCLPTEGPADAL